jgi:hypothetical protein
MAADKSGKTGEFLLDFLLTGQTNFFRIDDHYEVTRVDVGRIDGLSFAAKEICHRHRNPAKRTVLCVNDVPFPVYTTRFG